MKPEKFSMEVFIDDRDMVFLKFPVAVNHLALSPEQADKLSHSLHLKAEELRARRAEKKGQVH